MRSENSILSESSFITEGRGYALNSINFLPPVSQNNKIICVGINYPKLYNNVFTNKPDNIIIFYLNYTTSV